MFKLWQQQDKGTQAVFRREVEYVRKQFDKSQTIETQFTRSSGTTTR